MDALKRHGGRQGSRLRFVGLAAGLAAVLAGCAASPEASRAPGEPGADPGNHGNPIVLVAPPDRVERIYYEVPVVSR